MFDVKIIGNNASNNWLVRQFEIMKFSDTALEEKFIPRPDISIVFHFKDSPLIRSEKNIQLEPFFLAPIIPSSLVLNFHGEMDTFIAICKPTVFTRIFHLDLTPVNKRSIDLPPAIFSKLWTELSRLDTTQERIHHFTAFINSFQQTPYQPDAVDIFYDKMIENSAAVPIHKLARECPACKRTLERNFIKRTGVTPKVLMRIIRLNDLLSHLHDPITIDYQELVFDGHYFDQAHFIKDFKSIICETPGYFFNRNLQIAKMFSGKQEGTIR
ncbi:MAG: hypothetical protein BGP01_12675 [Paludibacter sp. 47-17]|nr:MAG: hypothetical protein BGP01_12675 [Paludibacter sp. 47-17]